LSTESHNFADVVQVQFDPMGFYSVTVFITKVTIEGSFSATNGAGDSVFGSFTMVDYDNASVQVNLIGQAKKDIVISNAFPARCPGC